MTKDDLKVRVRRTMRAVEVGAEPDWLDQVLILGALYGYLDGKPEAEILAVLEMSISRESTKQ